MDEAGLAKGSETAASESGAKATPEVAGGQGGSTGASKDKVDSKDGQSQSSSQMTASRTQTTGTTVGSQAAATTTGTQASAGTFAKLASTSEPTSPFIALSILGFVACGLGVAMNNGHADGHAEQ